MAAAAHKQASSLGRAVVGSTAAYAHAGVLRAAAYGPDRHCSLSETVVCVAAAVCVLYVAGICRASGQAGRTIRLHPLQLCCTVLYGRAGGHRAFQRRVGAWGLRRVCQQRPCMLRAQRQCNVMAATTRTCATGQGVARTRVDAAVFHLTHIATATCGVRRPSQTVGHIGRTARGIRVTARTQVVQVAQSRPNMHTLPWEAGHVPTSYETFPSAGRRDMYHHVP